MTVTFDAAAIRDPADRVATACNACGVVDTEPVHRHLDMSTGAIYVHHIACGAVGECQADKDDPAHCVNVAAARAAQPADGDVQ